jgi:hypothetical protein
MASMSTLAAVRDETPFFLVGSERSGTTLLRLMLAHHPQVECAPEFEFLVERVPADSSRRELAGYHEWLETNRVFGAHRLELDRSLDHASLARSFVAQHRGRAGKPIHGVTCHKHFDRLLSIWPSARFVHVLRDGRDVARSCIGMGWAGNVWTGAERWIEAESLWDGLVARIDPARRIELRYEDLITAPERELARLCAFLGTEFDPAMLEYTHDSSYERPDPALVAQWRRKLSRQELALLEARIGPLLRAKGYAESGVPAARVGAWRRCFLRLEDRLERFRFRCDRYGLGHVLRARLARALGARAWERRLQLAQNEIDNRHLQ